MAVTGEIIRLVSSLQIKKGGDPPLKTLYPLSFVSSRAPAGMDGRTDGQMDGWMDGQRDERKISIMLGKKKPKTIITQKCSCSVITACLIPPRKKDVRHRGQEHLRHRVQRCT